MKKIILFVISVLGFGNFIFAQTAVQPSGNGTQSNPYQIANLENLYWMTQHNSSGTYYVQTANIDASSSTTWDSGAGFDPVYFYECHYDGGGHTISGLYINRPSEHNLGLFSLVAGGSTVTNLTIDNASITGDYNCGIISGGSNSSIDGTGPTSSITNCITTGTVVCEYNGGGIVGSNNYYSLVDQCNSSVQINGTDYLQGGIAGNNHNHSQILNSTATGSVSGTYAVGGIAGSNSDGALIGNCMSSVNVSGTNYYIGGLAGRNKNNSIINNCGASGDVSGLDDVGGLVGYCFDSYVENSFSTGNVAGTGSVTGGFVGRNNNSAISNCYSFSNVNGAATAGGFVGYNYQGSAISNCYCIGAISGNSDLGGFAGMSNNATIDYSFWNVEVSGISNSAGGIGKSTSDLQSLCTYVDGTDANWDFMVETLNGTDDYWGLNTNENQGYPFLAWQGYSHTATCGAGIDELTSSIKIYPNPAKSIVIVEAKDFVIQQIEVVDTTGKVLLKKDNVFHKFVKIDLSGKEHGTYLIKIRMGKGVIVKKIIIE